MIIPDDIVETVLSLKDQYFDLRGLNAYSSLGISTIRDHINKGALPCFKVGGKILVRRSEFDKWIDNFRVRKNQELEKIVDDVLTNLKGTR